MKSRIIQQGDQREKWDDNPTICEYWVGLWECVARSNPQASTREPSAKQTAECEARLFVPQAAQSSPYRRIQIRNLIRDSFDERNRLRNGD